MLSVIIGRFQTPFLTEGHLKLFEEAGKNSSRILVLIGTTVAIGTDKNPLSYEMRENMIDGDEKFDDYLLYFKPLYDCPSDIDWSAQIDELIKNYGDEDVVIFGGRDNSIEKSYSGKHQIKIIEEVPNCSATALREKIAKKSIHGYNARAAVIHHIENRYPIVYSTVDVAICQTKWISIFGGAHLKLIPESILMGKKGDSFCFIGGFVDKDDQSLEEAALREALEETGFALPEPEYQFSIKVNDQRYRGAKDSIMTHLFMVEANSEELPDPSKISDKEFKEFAWIPANEDSLDLIADCHKPLFLKFINSKN